MGRRPSQPYASRADQRRSRMGPGGRMWSESPIRPIQNKRMLLPGAGVAPEPPGFRAHWYAADLIYNQSDVPVSQDFLIENEANGAVVAGVGTLRQFLGLSARGVSGITLDSPWTKMIGGTETDWEWGLWTCEGQDDFNPPPWTGHWATDNGQTYYALHTSHLMFSGAMGGTWHADLGGQAYNSSVVNFPAFPYPFGFQFLAARAFYTDWAAPGIVTEQGLGEVAAALGGLVGTATIATRPVTGTAYPDFDSVEDTIARFGPGYGGFGPIEQTGAHGTIGAYGTPAWAVVNVGWTP